MDEEAAIAALRSLLGARTFLTGSGLIARLAREANVEPMTARMVLGRLAQRQLISGVSSQGEPHSQVRLLVEAPPRQDPPSLARWRCALHTGGLAPNEVEALLPCHDGMADLSSEDQVAVVTGLLALRSNQQCDAGKPRFVLSARYLLGSSKMLGALPGAALRAFGINLDLFPDSPPYVVVAGPADPVAVVLIENPHAFEEMVRSGAVERVACITTFGYGLTRTGDAYGRQLAEMVTANDLSLIPLVRHGAPPSISSMLAHPALFFWGDLDREGIRIYASLRKRFPHLRASALFRPMLEALLSGRSHPYIRLAAKDNQSTLTQIPDDVGVLADACDFRAVDQEIVEQEDLTALGGLGFAGIADRR